METYESIKKWKDAHIPSYLTNNVELNTFHDQVMLKVLEIALERTTLKKSPCKFTWFITGSGGRLEQGLISDQDHGIVYEKYTTENDLYFKELGEELSKGLNIVGYPYCSGNIMSSNPIWCKSYKEWKVQLYKWMEEKSWESIRYLQIFYDARALYGDTEYINQLKTMIYEQQKDYPTLLKRLMENVKLLKNSIGPMGQILVEQHGVYQGHINLKYAAFLPYVNSVRLLSIKEGLIETSTLERIEVLREKKEYEGLLKDSYRNFELLMNYRLTLFQVKEYDDTHYLNLKNLTKDQRKEIKRILKYGKKLHDVVIELVNVKEI
ncbi:DUF294 nucleotidyltransferase-like domain-containing protein [Ureibacillus chungkukjangi]|uniref:DUF294 nucleotidyltransferase-like domain-containing protein n=1 Tax=Ureibacillus chungkukjangi TaxID=1202712 RepID=UPI002041BAB8|nr:DUF294 nucleotidyltransferase-like domain-containing protein [Ureibacillus chungkukjangi]MCM3389233.1 DUF294 nucleotidyltransferase-like domain-containing protein [Ureibacillus chungkukjangi]